MTARTGMRPVTMAVATLAAVHALHDLSTRGTPALQVVCWSTTAGAVLLWTAHRRAGAPLVTAWLLLVVALVFQLFPYLRRTGPLLAWAAFSLLLRHSPWFRARRRELTLIASALLATSHVAAATLLAGPPPPPFLAWADALLAGIVITHAVTVPFLAIVSSHRRLVELSLTARRVVSQMEHADPLDYTTLPYLLRVLEYLCRYPQMTSRDIATHLSLSTRTVETYVNRWVRLTGVDNRRQLVAMFEYYYLAEERVVPQSRPEANTGICAEVLSPFCAIRCRRLQRRLPCPQGRFEIRFCGVTSSWNSMGRLSTSCARPFSRAGYDGGPRLGETALARHHPFGRV